MKTSLAIVLAYATIGIGCSGDENAATPAPQDSAVPQVDGGDASVTGDGASSTPDGGSIDAPRTDGFIDIFDVFPIPEGAIGDCVVCVRDHCGTQLNQCLNDATCRDGLQCTLATCLASGMPDQACVLQCFMGNIAAAITAGAALMCVNTSCGAACMPNLDGGFMRDSSTTDGSPNDGAPASDATGEAASPESGTPDAIAPPADGASGD